MDSYEQRRLVSAFTYIDQLLAESLDILTNPESRSRFTHYTPDASSERRQLIEEQLHRVRNTMNHIMVESNVALPLPVCGALWAARSNVLMALVTIEELDNSASAAAVEMQLRALMRLISDRESPGTNNTPH
jgi:hypothetical protein